VFPVDPAGGPDRPTGRGGPSGKDTSMASSDTSPRTPARRLARRGAALAGSLALAVGAVVLSAGSAGATPV
jgi:hypothetical protein